MITFQKLEWSNCFSYGKDNAIELNAEPLTQITGVNGCLHPSSVIIGYDGQPYFISELVRNAPKDFYVMGVNADLTPCKALVTDFIENGKKPVFEVQLDSGDKLLITDNHKLLTYEGWKQLKDLKVNDFILDSNFRCIDEVKEVDELYWLISAYLNTEGGLSDVEKKITFTNKDKAIAAHFQELLHAYDKRINLTCTDSKRDFNYYITFNRSSKLKHDFINYITKDTNVLGYCSTKCFPREVINLPKSLLTKIMAIYLDTDGCVQSTEKVVSFSSSSKKQIQQLLYILRYRFEVACSIRTRKTRHCDNFEITITRLDQIKLFLKQVRAYLKSYKIKRVDELLATTDTASSSYTYNLVPKSLLINDGLDRLVIPKDRTKQTDVHRAYRSLRKAKHGIQRRNYELLLDAGVVTSIKNFNNTRFLRIKKITNIGEFTTYDLTTSTSNFIADGVLVHNSGKSSIPLLLEETLYNKNSRGIKKADIANRLLDGTYNVALDFLVDGVQHRVEITRNKVGVKAKLFRDGQDISDHTASNTFKSIEQILRIDHKTFSQLIYQGISSSLQFLTAPDTARKKFLVDLFGLEAYLEYFEKFKELAKSVGSQVNVIEGKISTIEKWLIDNKLDNPETLAKLELPELDTSLEKDLAELRLSAKNIDNTNAKIRANNLAKERIKELNTTNISVGITSPHETASIHSKLGGLKSEAATVKTAIDKFNKLPGRCPTCSQTIGEEFSSKYKEAASTKLNKLTKEIQILEQELTSKLEENKLLNKKQSIEREFESLYNSIDDSLPEELLVKNDIEKRAKEIEATIKAQKTKIEELITKNNMIERHNTKVSIYLEQHDKLKTQLEENRIALESLISLNTNIEVLKRAFSTNGLIAYKLEGLVKELEDLTNSYLAELSDGRFTIEFCIEKDKLNVVITDNGNEVNITALSSGELSRVNTATLLAIRRLMSSISKSRINVLFLDEVINVLDEYGREKLIEILVKEDKLNSFIVSHQWSHPLLTKVTVLKEKGISRIECQ